MLQTFMKRAQTFLESNFSDKHNISVSNLRRLLHAGSMVTYITEQVSTQPGASCLLEILWTKLQMQTKMFENFCSDIKETMKCFALESFNLSCQAQHTKINSRLNFNPGLALIAFSTTRPWLSICFVSIQYKSQRK